MTALMKLEVLTPDKIVLDTTTQSMKILLPDGWWGILPGHAPMIAQIYSGFAHYRSEDTTRYIALYEGTIEVQTSPGMQTRVILLTAAAEEGESPEIVQSTLEEQASKLAELAKEADLEFNQIRLSLEKSIHELTSQD